MYLIFLGEKASKAELLFKSGLVTIIIINLKKKLSLNEMRRRKKKWTM